MCHSDLHQVYDEWGNTKFPCLPGHEITGIVTEVGGSVSKFKVRQATDQLIGGCWSACMSLCPAVTP